MNSVYKEIPLKFKDIYKISNVVYNENILEGMLISSGSQKEKYLENLEKNKRSVKNNAIAMKILSAVFIFIISLSQIQLLIQIKSYRGYINPFNFQPLLFSFIIPIILLYGSYFLFLFTYGMTLTVGFFNNETYIFLQTLPIEKKYFRKIIYLSFIKTINYQFLAMVFCFPIISYYFIPEIQVLITGLISSFFNSIFCISLMILIANFMANRIFKIENISKSQTALRMIVSILYMFSALLIGFSFSYLTPLIMELFNKSLMIGESGALINYITSFIFWPLSISYIFGLGFIPIQSLIDNFASYRIIIFGISFGIAIILYIAKKSINILSYLGKYEKHKHKKMFKEKKIKKIEQKEELKILKEKKSIKFNLNVTSERIAIIKKDFKYFTRNFQSLMYLIIPTMLAIIAYFVSSTPLENGNLEEYIESFHGAVMINLIYLSMSIIISIIAVTSAENDTANILYTLPISNLTVFRAKRMLIYIIIVPPILINLILSLKFFPKISYISIIYFIYYILSCNYSINIGLCLYAILFGKLKNKYYLQQINLSKKALKSIIGCAILIIMIIGPFILGLVLYFKNLINEFSLNLTILIFCVLFAILSIFLTKRIFNKSIFKF